MNYFREDNYTSSHIGSHLMFCKYLGKQCSFLNFTRLRDPLLTDCYTFQPQKRELSVPGKVLTLGLYTNQSLMMYYPNFIVSLHEEGTLPNIMQDGYIIDVGGITDITFRTTHIKRYDRRTKRCSVNKTAEYSFTKTNGVFKYTANDCFQAAYQVIFETSFRFFASHILSAVYIIVVCNMRKEELPVQVYEL